MHGCADGGVAGMSEVAATAWDLLHPVARAMTTRESSFCGFDFRTKVANTSLGTIPAQLAGAAIWLSAVRADNVTVEIRSSVELIVDKNDANVPLASPKLVVMLDAADWLANIDFNSLVPSADGVVHVTSTSNAAVLHLVEQQTLADILMRNEEADDGVIDN